MKKIIKFKLLILFAILFSVSIINAIGIEAKMEWPEPVIDLSENEINDNDAGISKKYDIGISDTDIISSLIRDDSTKMEINL